MGRVVCVSGLSKGYPGTARGGLLRHLRHAEPVWALREVDLEVARGEVLGILGTNGAGKTTLLKVLASLVLPSAGRATVDGHDVVRNADLVRRSIGFSAGEDRSFYWRLTGRQNLEFFAAFQGLSARAGTARIEDLRDMLGLEALERRVGTYSTGMRHRLSLARALLHAPRVLLLDEPTRSLDPLAGASLRRVIRDALVRDLECAVLMATHNLEEAVEVCDRVAILHQGRRVAYGHVGDLFRRSGAIAGGLARTFDALVEGGGST